jgi:hypothetical protein
MTSQTALKKLPAMSMNTLPDEILHDIELNLAIDHLLPSNYSFEGMLSAHSHP